jgi:ubiquinone/menaquinone biosynthesis C-methylase UbiE
VREEAMMESYRHMANDPVQSSEMTYVVRQLRAAYDQLVVAYADRNHGAMPDKLLPLAGRLVLHVGSGGHLIDVGCGTGRDMAWFETRALSVTGIDLSTGMLSYARGKVSGNLLIMNMCRLAFRNDCFDGAWCCASILHVPKREAAHALGEIRRVLRTGGMLAISVQQGSDEGWEESYVPGVRRFFARYTVAEFSDLLGEAGFATDDIGTSLGNDRDWLSCTCIAE